MYILISVLVLPVLSSAQSIQELQRLKAEYEQGQKQIQPQTWEGGSTDPTTGLPRQAQITPYQPIEITDEMEEEAGLKHFGYDFFTRRDTVAFWENLPTPANYLLGSGD